MADPLDRVVIELLNQILAGIYCLDHNRKITYWNDEAQRLSGYLGQEICGKSCADDILCHVDDSGRRLCNSGCPVAATLQDGQIHEGEVYMHHHNGHRVAVKVKILPIHDSEGVVVGAVQIFLDNAATLETREKMDRLQELALSDFLTGLPNRAYMEAELQCRHDKFQRTGSAYGVAIIDIDNFKQINDRFGHDIGDAVLKMIGKTLLSACRSYDQLGRWGGEEFLAIITLDISTDLKPVAERMRAFVQESFIINDTQRIGATVSIGMAQVAQDESAASVVKRADKALYESKQSGRNRVTIAP